MKKIMALGLASVLSLSGLAALGGGFVAEEAVAGTVATCDAGVVTLTKVDAADSKPLAEATFRVTSADNVWLTAGDSTLTDAEFKADFTAAWAASNDETGAVIVPAEITEAYASVTVLPAEGADAEAVNNTTGRAEELLVPALPSDITGLLENTAVGTAAKIDAITSWQGTAAVADLSSFIDQRVEALNAAKTLADSGNMAVVNADAYANLEASLAKATTLKQNVDTLKVAVTDDAGVAGFVTAYDYVVEPLNWTDDDGISALGMTQAVSLKWLDYVAYGDGADVTDANTENVAGVSAQFDAANETAANANGLVQDMNVVTGGDGVATFKVFGVDTAYANDDTRGSASCAHLEGVAIETIAPEGYVLNSDAQGWVLNDDGTAEYVIENTKWDAPELDTPDMRNNGGI